MLRTSAAVPTGPIRQACDELDRAIATLEIVNLWVRMQRPTMKDFLARQARDDEVNRKLIAAGVFEL